MANNSRPSPHYKVGTVTFTAGSINFTVAEGAKLGIDTDAANVMEGDEIYVPGQAKWLTIQIVIDSTSGTLIDPCPEECAGTFPLRIRFQSFLPRMTNGSAALSHDMFLNANLLSIADITANTGDILQAKGRGDWSAVPFNQKEFNSKIDKVSNAIKTVSDYLMNIDIESRQADAFDRANLFEADNTLDMVAAKKITIKTVSDYLMNIDIESRQADAFDRANLFEADNTLDMVAAKKITIKTVSDYLNKIDPKKKRADAFDMANMVEADNALIMTTAERAVIRNDSEKLSKIDLLSLLPSGLIAAFAMQSAPAGWLVCDGDSVLRTDYTDLFAAIGTIWGEGDGSTTFNLPDLRAEFLRGWDNGRDIDSQRDFASFQGDAMRNINGTLWTGGVYGFDVFTQASGVFSINLNTNWRANTRQHFVAGAGNLLTFDLSTTDMPLGPEIRPRNKAVLYCIKY